MRFFDTNILVYAVDPTEPVRRPIARQLLEQSIAGGEFTISTQVLQEFYNVALRRKLVHPRDALRLMQTWAESDVVNSTPQMLFRACALQQSRRLSLWDALIVQAALDAGCCTLYSEDLQAGARFGGLEVVNPFPQSQALQEPAAHYAAKPSR